MLKSSDAPVSRTRTYRGSAMLDSSFRRVLRILIVVALMWLLAGWSMDWW